MTKLARGDMLGHNQAVRCKWCGKPIYKSIQWINAAIFFCGDECVNPEPLKAEDA